MLPCNEADTGFNVPRRASGQTSDWSGLTREREEPIEGAKHMTADGSAGAVPREPEGWHTIDWRAATEHVRRLQARIVKATQEGRWGKVQALPRRLTHSFRGKALAFKRVTETRANVPQAWTR